MGLRATWQRTFQGIKDKIEIYDEDFTPGTTLELTAASTPFDFSHQEITSESSEGILNPYANRIMKGVLDFNFKVETTAEQTLHADMLDTDDQRFKIVWEQDDSVYWQGYIDTKKRTWQERPRYTASVRATDFDYLKSIEYSSDGTPTGNPQENREKQIVIIAEILDNLNFGINIETETCWIVDGQTSTDDYLEQTYKDKFALREYATVGGEEDEPITVYQALEKVTEGLIVKQIGGVWKLTQIPSYDDPSGVYQFVYNSSGVHQSGGAVDLRQTLQTSIDDGDTTVSWKSGNDGYPSIRKARVRYDHRTKISGFKIPSVVFLDGNVEEEFTQLFISDGDQEIQLVANVNALVDDPSISFGDRGYAVFKIQAGSYWWNGSNWVGSETDFRVEIFGPFERDGLELFNGAVNIVTSAVPIDADGNLVLTFLQSEYDSGGVTTNFDSTEFLDSSISVINSVLDENSSQIDYQLTQSGGRLGLDLPVSWFGDGPTGYSRGAISTDSAGTQFTSGDWARRGEMAFINYHNNLLRDYIDSQRSWTRRINAQMWIGYNPEKIGVYDGNNYMYAGGSYRNGRWTPSLFRVNIQTATDTFQDLPKFEQTGTSGSSSGSIVDIVEQNDNTYPWQQTIISEVASLPASPDTGDRHIFEDNVRVWNGSEWLSFTPSEGWTLYNEDLGKYMVYETRASLDWYVWDGLNFFQNTDTDYSTISSGAGSGYRGTYYGFDSNGTGDGQTKLGYNNSGDIGDYTLSLGYEALKDNIYNNVIGIGRGTVATANNQFIVAQTNVNATPLIKGNFTDGSITLDGIITADNVIASVGYTGGTLTLTKEDASTFTASGFYEDWTISTPEDSNTIDVVTGRTIEFRGTNDVTLTSGTDAGAFFVDIDVQGTTYTGWNLFESGSIGSGFDIQSGERVTFKGSGATTISITDLGAGDDFEVDISSTNTTYTAGAGLSLSGTEFSVDNYNNLATTSQIYNGWNITASSGTQTPLFVDSNDTVNLIEGSNVTVSRTGNDITISASGGASYTGWTLEDAGGINTNVDEDDVVKFTGTGLNSITFGGGLYTVEVTDTQRTDEEIEDVVGAMLSGNTETLITVTYQDGDGTIDFVVDNDLSNYSNATSDFATSSEIYNNWVLSVTGSGVADQNIGSLEQVTFEAGTDIALGFSTTNNTITIAYDGTQSSYSWFISGGGLVSAKEILEDDEVAFAAGTGLNLAITPTDGSADPTVTYSIDTGVVPRLNVNNDFGTNTLTAGNLLNGSDRKWKTEFSDDYDALWLVGQLKDKFYKKYDRYYEFGFVAQDLQGIDMIDNLVFDMEHGLNVNYNGITALNSGAINTLNTKVDSEIERLEKQISELETKVRELKNAN